MLESKFSFDGSFHPDCQQEVVLPSLLALVNMIMNGANIKHQTETAFSTSTAAAYSISQLLVYNSVKHTRSTKSKTRHSRERETPVPLYVALKIHSTIRSRGLVDVLFNLGMCVSYDRLL